MAWKLLEIFEILLLEILYLRKAVGKVLIETPFTHSQKSHYCLVCSVYFSRSDRLSDHQWCGQGWGWPRGGLTPRIIQTPHPTTARCCKWLLAGQKAGSNSWQMVEWLWGQRWQCSTIQWYCMPTPLTLPLHSLREEGVLYFYFYFILFIFIYCTVHRW